MEIAEKLRNMSKDKRMMTAVVILGITGLVLIMISSLVPEKEKTDELEYKAAEEIFSAEDYRSETEKRLESFLGSIDGAGDVRVYLTVGSDERYIYATEGRRSKSENKTEEERKYVMIGGGSDKSALIETVETPAITGAVIACSGSDSPAVQEQIYRAVSAALGIPTGKIYVTKLKR